MSIILRDARVIDGCGGAPASGFVVIENSQIVKVGKGPGPSKKKDLEVIDLDGRCLLPGMIDCHVHLCIDGSADPMQSLQKDPPALIALKAARNAQRSVLAGVTTVRDLGCVNGISGALRDAINLGVATGSRVVTTNQAICMTGGHGWQFSRQADGPDDVRRAVREQIRAGADAIKMIATGGVMTQGVEPGSPQFTLEELRAGAEEAHKAGRKITTHAQGNEGIKNSLRAGFDAIEHGIFLDDEAIALFLEKRVTLVPTLSAPFNIMQKGEKSGIPAHIIEKTQGVKDTHLASVRKAHRAGITIASGTDAGTPFNLHGDNLKELELLVGIGLSPMEAIVSATRVAAEALGLGSRIGTLQPGKLADLIVVEGDPLKDIAVLQRRDKMVVVMKDGQFCKKSI
ncbi:MAG: amidohydrolase family protein [Deltaproteobacteria bacterium]